MNEKCWYKEVCNNRQCDNCIRYSEMKYLMDNSGIPEKRQMPVSLTCEREDKDAFIHLADIKDDILDFVDAGKSLYIGSSVTGNGKTSWAIKLLLKYFDSVWAGNGLRIRGYFIHVPTFLHTMKDFNNDHSGLRNIIENADLVVWDDVAATKTSDYDMSQLLSLVDTRMCRGLSNIFTGNIDSKEGLKQAVGDRLASRIWASEIIILKGKDRR